MPEHEQTPPREDNAPPSPGLLRRFAGGCARFLAGLLIWAIIVFAVALFIVEGKTVKPRTSSHSAVPVTADSFIQPDVCSGCHWDIFRQWSGTMHSLANKDPFYTGLYDIVDADTQGRAEQYCGAEKCHAPAGFLAGESPFPHDKMSATAQAGVFCDFCHTVASSRGVGDASYFSSPGRIKRGPYRNARSPYHWTAYSKLHTQSRFCGMCHNVSNPITGLKLETTYDEWARSPYNTGNPATTTECQDCHMRPRAGRACSTGPRRPNVFAHRFGGGNAFIPAKLGFGAPSRAAVARLKSVARVSIASAKRVDTSLILKVRVSNVGAGHSLPTGITEVRQMWLLVTVTGGRGEIYASGKVDSDGNLDETTHLFHTVLGDVAGNPVTKVWRAARILRDHRVPPKGSLVERYEIEVPRDAGALRVAATLKYRSAPQDLVNTAVGRGKLIVPVVDMAAASVVVPAGP